MDAWGWAVLAAVLVPVVLILLSRRALRRRVDPTEVTIEPDLARQVGELYAQGSRSRAVALLRGATGLSTVDAAVVAERLGRRHREAD